MASETPGGQRKLPMKLPMVGLLLGAAVASLVLSVIRRLVFGTELEWVIPTVIMLIGCIVGGGIGGLTQLWIQGRVAEIPRFLRHLLCGFLWLSLLWGWMFVAAWLGERFYGRVGYWVGLLGSVVLWFLVPFWLFRRSLSEKPSQDES